MNPSYWKNLFFNPRGRIGRKQWWIGYLMLLAVGLAYTALEMFINTDLDPNDKGAARLASYRYLAYSLLVLWPWLALYAKRLHDLGRTSWWGALLLVPSYFYIFFELAGITDGTRVISLLSVVLLLLIYLPVPVEGLWLGGVIGDRGDNQFGPDPLPAAFYQRPQQSWLHTLFGWKGRLSRSWFWTGIGASLALLLALFILFISYFTIELYRLDITMMELASEKYWNKLAMNSTFLKAVWIYLAASLFLLLYNLLALLWKRLHDQNRSGLWLFAPLLLSMIAFVAYILDASTIVLVTLLTLALLILIWLLAETLFLRGTSGPNKYGPDPLAPLTPSGGETN